MSEKYISFFPKPLLADLANGKWLPFIGAGFSRNAILPQDKFMPNWNQLGDLFKKEIEDCSLSTPLEIISDYEHEFSRNKLIEKLFDFLNIDDAKPGLTHEALCNIPFNTICTTNFDKLLEKTFEMINKPYYVIMDENQLGFLNPSIRTSIFKIHGDIHYPKRMILSEDDYDLFFVNYPILATYIGNLLIDHNPIFIGYSLNDPDFRLIWQIIKTRLGNLNRPAYAILVEPSQSEIRMFERRGVHVINLPKRKNWTTTLELAFNELSIFYLNNVIKKEKVIESDVKSEITVKREKSTRLCFFSVPIEGQSYYRDVIFPIVSNYGFVPVTIDDVRDIGDNIRATIEGLISQSSLLFIDLDSKFSEYEYEIGKNYILKENIFVVGEVINFQTTDYYRIIKPDSNLESYSNKQINNEFLNEIEKWFQGRSKAFSKTFENEPRRLLNAKENRAAVIAAITLLETSIQNFLLNRGLIEPQFRISLIVMVRILIRNELISKKQEDEISKWINIRNLAVHSTKPVRKPDAIMVVDGVYEFLSNFNSIDNKHIN